MIDRPVFLGPQHFETNCGFKCLGRTVRDAIGNGAVCQVFGDLVRVELKGLPGASVLLVFEDGTGVLLPAIQDFIAALTFDGNELSAVAYEPSDNSWRWQVYQASRVELATLRNVIASAARLGVFRLDSDDADTLARRMQMAKGIDPALGLYAAYAYDALGRRSRLRQMADYMRQDLKLCLFDIALLAGELDGQAPARIPGVFPFAPILSQGWARLGAAQVKVPQSMTDVQRHVLPSLWTLYDSTGVETLRVAIAMGEVR